MIRHSRETGSRLDSRIRSSERIEQKDECQWEVHHSLVEDGKSVVGELASKAAYEAGEFFGLRVSLDADYDVGKNWKDCH